MCDELAKQLADSPVGWMLLAQLEVRERLDVRNSDWDGRCDIIAVSAAANRVNKLDFSDIVRNIQRAVSDTSPWNSTSQIEVPMRRFCTRKRLPIANIIIDNFSKNLAANFEPDKQEIWRSKAININSDQNPKDFISHGVYDQGQFTWASIRSLTTPNRRDILDWILTDKWNRFDQTCYKPVISKDVLVYEIHSFEDWVDLIKGSPNPASTPAEPIAPDWEAISEKYDAVHLSWMGILLAHDNLERAEAENIIPLRYWEHEQTHWLNNCIDSYEEVFTYKELKCETD